MANARPESARRDWLSKTLAGSVLGLSLGLLCSGVLAMLLSGLPLSIRAQLVMWLVAPVWLATLSTCYFFSSGRQAWAWLGLANALGLVLLVLLRLTSP